jgi:ABC-type transport system involved in multi-copper enzyme maturation permease subunit
MVKSHIRTLSEFLFRELWKSRVCHILFLTWLVSLLIAFLMNWQFIQAEVQQYQTNQAEIDHYYQNLPNSYFFFATVYTLQRPINLTSFIARGTSFLAPNSTDYLPRYSPNFYYSDDSNAVFRLFRPFDLVIVIGVVGSLLALILTYKEINGEYLNNNYYFLLLSGVSPIARYFSKIIAFQTVFCGTFVVAYLLAIFSVVRFFEPALAVYQGEFFWVGVICCLYLAFAVQVGLTLSALFKKQQVSFSVGIVFFLLQVFVTPLTVQELQSVLGTAPPNATDLQERKIHFSRLIHRRLDPSLHSLRVRAQTRPFTIENLATVWSEDEKNEFFMFVNNNSNYAMLADKEFFEGQAKFAEKVIGSVSWLSPFFAFQMAASEIVDTGFKYETALVKELSWNHFLKYRKWFWKIFMPPVNWGSVGLEKWIFAKNFEHHEMSDLGIPESQHIKLTQKISNILGYIFSLILWGTIFLFLGLWGVQRTATVRNSDGK